MDSNIMHSGHIGLPDTIFFYLSLFHSTTDSLLVYNTYLFSFCTYPMPNPLPCYYIQYALDPTILVYKLY